MSRGDQPTAHLFPSPRAERDRPDPGSRPLVEWSPWGQELERNEEAQEDYWRSLPPDWDTEEL